MPEPYETPAQSWTPQGGDTTTRVRPIHDMTNEPAPTAEASASTAMSEAIEAVEDYVKQHPMQVLIGAVAVGGIVALALSGRRGSRRSNERRWLREAGSYAEDMQRAASREARALLKEVRRSRTAGGFADDISSALSPVISTLVSALTTAKEKAGDAVSSVAKTTGLK
jgi:hypothetical protein